MGEGQVKPNVVVDAEAARRRALGGAAELVRRYRKLLHRAGCFDLELPRGVAMPAWADAFLECLRQRPAKWRVAHTRGKKGGSVYRVFWLYWTKYGPRRQSPRPRGN